MRGGLNFVMNCLICPAKNLKQTADGEGGKVYAGLSPPVHPSTSNGYRTGDADHIETGSDETGKGRDRSRKRRGRANRICRSPCTLSDESPRANPLDCDNVLSTRAK